jgi:hypothetical protein
MTSVAPPRKHTLEGKDKKKKGDLIIGLEIGNETSIAKP